MDDTISRQMAIDAIDSVIAIARTIDDGLILIDKADAQAELSKLPSAQPERKTGKWIYGEDEYGIDGYHCNKCGFFVPWDYAHNFINYIEDYNFCPNCGAEMREVIE